VTSFSDVDVGTDREGPVGRVRDQIIGAVGDETMRGCFIIDGPRCDRKSLLVAFIDEDSGGFIGPNGEYVAA
jgi:hypothetical protein